MVKIAVAGGTGNIAGEIIEALLSKNRHQVVVLTRKDAPIDPIVHPDITYVKVDYKDKASLTNALRGVHTVLSFIVVVLDPGSVAQKNLIDASIEAGVKRFAPSEWGSSNVTAVPWYVEKETVREYLREVNRERKVLEYCLFQCGIFSNNLATPHKTAKHLVPIMLPFDFQNRRAIVLEGRNDIDSVTFTKVQDVANIVAEAIDYEGEWPVVGGIRGNNLTVGQVLALGEKIRGKPFAVETLTLEDIESGNINTSWYPVLEHPSIPKEEIESFSKMALGGTLIGIAKAAYTIPTDEWNKLLPSYKFADIEEFLYEAWAGKP
ncbi:unnamed protein product [Somion occarium]|uniref:NmrA-like domain-containing protein n=1 Tax=Somion occarium TaxID=3059160 RepID=A0ABP1E2X6_9APHY